MMKNFLYTPNLAVERVLFLDGLGRAGKNLLGKIVSNFVGVEYFQYQPIIEHLPILNYLGNMNRNDAISYLRISLNMYIYDRAIGRNMNLRISDGSSVLNSHELKVYDNRRQQPDGPSAITTLKSQNRIPSFMIHECMPHIKFFQEAIPDLLMINIQRHPIDIVSSWYLRGWGERYGIDPLAFIPALKQNEIAVPWFAELWRKEYQMLSPLNRTIKTVYTLYNLAKRAYLDFKHKEKQILLLSYEIFFSTPFNVIKKIEDFLQTSPCNNIGEILKREGCPKAIPLNERKKKFDNLRSMGEPSLIEKLVEISVDYEKLWELKKLF